MNLWPIAYETECSAREAILRTLHVARKPIGSYALAKAAGALQRPRVRFLWKRWYLSDGFATMPTGTLFRHLDDLHAEGLIRIERRADSRFVYSATTSAEREERVEP